MARRKTFDQATVVRAARDVFWVRGYEGSSLERLQGVMGLSRSSLYETFGSKRALFTRAVDSYLTEVIGPRLAPLEREDAGPAALVTYFRGFAHYLRQAPPPLARRGCLLINTATELDLLDDEAARAVEAYRERVRFTFRTAIGRGTSTSTRPIEDAERRAELLTAQLVGLFLTSRLNPTAAADLADIVADDIATWSRSGPSS